MISKKHKKVCRVLNYLKHLLIFIYIVSRCVLISVFASLVSVPVGITNSAVCLKICAIIAGIKRYKSIIKKKRKKQDNVSFSGKNKLNAVKVLISKVTIDSYINHGEVLSVNNLLREYNEMKEEIKNPKNALEYTM